ncbi:MAG: VCBS repeat-containing protein [Limisphaerales bacterium]
MLTNRGNGRFGSNATLAVTAPTSVTANDVNGDGKPDLICASFNPSVLTVFINNGHGGFAPKPALPLGTLTHGPIFPESVTTADLNGDGRPDLICANTTNVFNGVGAFVIFTNNASYQFGSNATINVGAFSVCVTAADVNADGKPDLISANQAANTLTVLINTNIFSAPAFIPVVSGNLQSNAMSVSWPSVSPGWSLEEIQDIIKTNWLPSGYGGYSITDDGTNKSLTLPKQSGNLFFRLIHP